MFYSILYLCKTFVIDYVVEYMLHQVVHLDKDIFLLEDATCEEQQMSWDGMACVSRMQFSPLLPTIHTRWCCVLLLVPLIFGVGLPSVHSVSVCWFELLALAVWKRTEHVSVRCLTVVFNLCSVSWCIAPGNQVWGCCILAWCIKQSTVTCILYKKL